MAAVHRPSYYLNFTYLAGDIIAGYQYCTYSTDGTVFMLPVC